MVTIIPNVLREQVEQGMKLNTLAEHYGLPKSQMKKALQQLGLKIRRLQEPKFIFADETCIKEEDKKSVNFKDKEVDEEVINQRELSTW
jgi:predicted transcriptional regulator